MSVAGGVSVGQLQAGNAPTQFPGLLPANVALLQPGSGYFRLADALTSLDQSVNVATIQTAISNLTTTVTSLQTTIAAIQATQANHEVRIASLEARLAAAGIP